MDSVNTAGHPAPVQWRVGDALITKIEERAQRIPLRMLISGVTDEGLAFARSWMGEPYLYDDDTFDLPFSGFVIEADGIRTLVDTCIGPEHEYGDPASPFVERLGAAGFAPDTIDAVITTHCHMDHVGWNTTVVDGVRRPTFGQARYHVAVHEWEALDSTTHAPEDGGFDHVAASVRPLMDAGKLDLVRPGSLMSSSIRLIDTAGHSPGHLSVVIESAGAMAVISGDAMHHPLQVVNPGWGSEPDEDSGAARVSRAGLIDFIVDNGALLIGSHFAGSGGGHLRDVDGIFRYVPASPDPHMR